MMTEKSAGFILISNNFHISCHSVLLLHYTSGHWDFPKGNIELDETEIQTASRELKEETGISKFRLIPKFRYVINYKYSRKANLISKQVILFLASTDVKRVQISHEHTGYNWADIKIATNQITFANAKNALLSATKFLQDLPSNINY